MKRIVSVLLLLVLLLSTVGALSGCGNSSALRTFSSVTEMDREDVTLGTITGLVGEAVIKEKLPHASLLYYKSASDLALQTAAGAIDGFVIGEQIARELVSQVGGLCILPGTLKEPDIALMIAKDGGDEILKAKLNMFIRQCREDGTLTALREIWSGDDETKKTVEFPETGENGNIDLGAIVTNAPFCYYRDNEIIGYDIDLLSRFCREYGYGINVHSTDLDGVLAGTAGGQFDVGCGGLLITPEREESVGFTETYAVSSQVMVTRESVGTAKYTSTAQLQGAGKKFGVVTGMVADQYTAQFFPEATIVSYNTFTDVIQQVRSGALDAYIVDEPLARYAKTTVPELRILPEILEHNEVGTVIRSDDVGAQLKSEFDAFVKECLQNGVIEQIDAVWFGTDETRKTVDVPATGPRGTLRMAVVATSAPFTYYKDNEIVGYEVDLVSRFCREYGYGLEPIAVDFSGFLTGISTGVFDLGCGCVCITPERLATVRFSDPYYFGGQVVVVLGENTAPEKNLFETIGESFEKNFIRESRWKLILRGVATTMWISVAAVFFGTFLGFGICLLRRMKNRVAVTFAKGYVKLLQGTPLVVLLMILFYVVFANTGLSGEWVAVIGFALNFGAYVSEMIRTGLDAVDRGQTEAALALGFTRPRAFFRIILPQAARHFLPVYTGEFISLVKMTSIVGYIAVEDLTKMSDIIRSRTFEAFFPLIATAILYFLICSLLTRLLRILERRLQPNRKRKKLKGVQTHDQHPSSVEGV